MIIVTRNKNNRVEIFEVPDDDLERYKVTSRQSDEILAEKEAIDLYRMEYGDCAKRYENLYAAVWTNFSYMAVISGAVLTFGSTRLPIVLSAFVACCPLLFWWFATFEKLDRYGNDVLSRLIWLEKIINKLSGLDSKPTGATDIPSDQLGLRHYQGFATKNQIVNRKEKRLRIITATTLFLIVLVTSLIGLRLVPVQGTDNGLMYWLLPALGALLAVVGLWLFFERRLGTAKTAFKEMMRVRFAVRVMVSCVGIVAICCAWQSLKLHHEGKLFETPTPTTTTAPQV